MKIILFANSDWYLYNFRLVLAKAIRNMGIEVVLMSPSGKYTSRLEEEGFRCIDIPMNRQSINPYTELKSIKEIFITLKKESPDLIHNFTIKSVIYGSACAFLAGIKYRINALAGMGVVFTDNSIKMIVIRLTVRILLTIVLKWIKSLIILQNTDNYKFITNKLKISEDRVRLIRGSGVNVDKFVLREYPRKQNKLKILLATRLLWAKGVKEFVEAARILKNENPLTEFLVAGEPDIGNPLYVPEKYLKKWEGEKTISFLGHVDDMVELLKSVDIVILPTSYGEGVPRILLEAAANGLPIVCTDIAGCKEIVEHEINGLLVPIKDVPALTAAIRHLINNEETRRKYGLRGREKVVKEFAEEFVIEETINVYKELINIAH